MDELVVPIPSPTQVGNVIGETLNREVLATRGRAPDAAARRKMYWWTYRDGEGRKRFAWGCDLNFVAFVGAAFLSFPPSRAQENIRAKQIEVMLEENAREILNILTQCLNVSGGLHLVLAEQGAPESEETRMTLELLSPSLRDQSDLDVMIAGYGTGKVSMARLVEAPVAVS